MEGSDEELFDPHYPLASYPDKMVNDAMLEEQKPRVRTRSGGGQNERRKSRGISGKFRSSERDRSKAEKNDKSMHDSLCKPVSINISKLSNTRVNVFEKSESSSKELTVPVTKTRPQRRSITKSVTTDVRPKRTRKSDLNFDNKAEEVVSEIIHVKRRKCATKKESLEELLTTVKQPYIKIHRIDEVINKLALSFAKVISNKRCEGEKSKCTEKSQVELNVSHAEPSVSNSNELNDKYNKNSTFKSHETNSSLTELPQLLIWDKDDDSSSNCDEIFEFNKRQTSRSKKRHLDASDCNRNIVGVNSDTGSPASQGTKRLRTDLQEHTINTSNADGGEKLGATEPADIINTENVTSIDTNDEENTNLSKTNSIDTTDLVENALTKTKCLETINANVEKNVAIINTNDKKITSEVCTDVTSADVSETMCTDAININVEENVVITNNTDERDISETNSPDANERICTDALNTDVEKNLTIVDANDDKNASDVNCADLTSVDAEKNIDVINSNDERDTSKAKCIDIKETEFTNTITAGVEENVGIISTNGERYTSGAKSLSNIEQKCTDAINTNVEENVINTECTDKDQVEPAEKVSSAIIDESCSPDNRISTVETDVDALPKNSCTLEDESMKSMHSTSVDNNIEKDSTSTNLPLELNPVYTMPDDISADLESDSGWKLGDTIPGTRETQKPTETCKGTISLSESLIQKHKLLKELRISLIRLDHIKKSVHNKRSSREIERSKNADSNDEECRKDSSSGVSSFLASSKDSNTNSAQSSLCNDIESAKEQFGPNIYQTQNNGNSKTVKETQHLPSISRRSSIMHRRRNKFLFRKRRKIKSKVQKSRHDTTKLKDMNTDAILDPNSSRHSEQESSVVPSRTEDPLQSPTESSQKESVGLSGPDESNIDRGKTENIQSTKNSGTSCSKETVSSPKANSVTVNYEEVAGELLNDPNINRSHPQDNEEFVSMGKTPNLLSNLNIVENIRLQTAENLLSRSSDTNVNEQVSEQHGKLVPEVEITIHKQNEEHGSQKKVSMPEVDLIEDSSTQTTDESPDNISDNIFNAKAFPLQPKESPASTVRDLQHSVIFPKKNAPSTSQQSKKLVSSLPESNSVGNSGHVTEKLSNNSSDTNPKYVLSQRGEKLLTWKKMRAIKSHRSATNIAGTKLNTKMSTRASYSSITSPVKHKKCMDKRDSKSTTYECIVCNLCFQDFTDLQQHLVVHTQKHNTSIAASKSSAASTERQQNITSDSTQQESTQSEQKHSKEAGSSKGAHSVCVESNKQGSHKGSPSKSCQNKSKKRKRMKSIAPLTPLPNECTICSQVFDSDTDLAAHIYLHTESELQEAYKRAKEKMEQGSNRPENQVPKEAAAPEKAVVDSPGSNKKETTVAPLTVQDVGGTVTEPAVLSEKCCTSMQTSLKKKLKKGKTKKVLNSRKSFTICSCHKKPGTNENCLQIEILLLCHSCRVLFRTIECFETHYRLPEYKACCRSRLNSSRSPNLFCVRCGMIFTSVQDVRHHLEIHARFRDGYITDFRCNICKVIFIGIGSLLYIHWAMHAKDPFWRASEQSFPKDSIIKSKPTNDKDKASNEKQIMASSKSVAGYLQVAEYVCPNCKLPFVTDSDLKRHVLTCKACMTKEIVPEKSENINVKEAMPTVSVKVFCTLCNNTITEKADVYKHIKDDHKFNIDPHFVPVSFTETKKVLICNVCMDIVESLQQLEDHWLEHSIKDIRFTCSCGKVFSNSFSSLLDHFKEHKGEVKEDVLSCTVSYYDTKLVCKHCNIGFVNSESFSDHETSHKTEKTISNDAISSTQNKVSNKESLVSETNKTVNNVTSKDLNTEEKNKDGMNYVNAKTSLAEEQEIIGILDGSDDSEHELVIDLSRQVGESTEKIPKKEEINLSPSNISVTETKPMTLPQNEIVSNGAQKIENAALVSMGSSNVVAPVASQVQTLETKTCINAVETLPETIAAVAAHIQISTEQVENSRAPESHDTVIKECEKATASESVKPTMYPSSPLRRTLIRNVKPTPMEDVTSALMEDVTIEKKEDSTKSRIGSLRVKTLEELRGPAQLVKVSGCSTTAVQSLAKSDENTKTLQNTNDRDKSADQSATNSVPETNSSEKSSIKAILIPIQLASSGSATTANEGAQLSGEHANRRSPVQNVTSAYHKNLPVCNIVQPVTPIQHIAPVRRINSATNSSNTQGVQKTGAMEKTVSMESGTDKSSDVTTFSNVIIMNNSQYRYKCKHCDFRAVNLAEFLLHELPGTSNACKKQQIQDNTMKSQGLVMDNNLQIMKDVNTVRLNTVPDPCLPTVINQPNVNCAPANMCFQPCYRATNNYDKGNRPLQQSQQIMAAQPVTGNASTPVYYKNSNTSGNGGMSIVISQTAPTVQNIPTIGILQQPAQQQMYQPTGYVQPGTILDAPYVEQPQTVVDYSGAGDLYRMTNHSYNIPNGEAALTTYDLRLQPTCFVCPHCPKPLSFFSNDMLQVHINLSHNYRCNVCNMRFYNLNDMYMHKAKHNFRNM